MSGAVRAEIAALGVPPDRLEVVVWEWMAERLDDGGHTANDITALTKQISRIGELVKQEWRPAPGDRLDELARKRRTRWEKEHDER